MEYLRFPAGELSDIKYVCIYAKYKGKWVACWHKYRKSWEFPGGHVEQDESVLDAAKRELYEETGANQYKIYALWDYEVGPQNNGRAYFAQIEDFGKLPKNEMERIDFFDDVPEVFTYNRDKVRKNLDRVEKYLLAHDIRLGGVKNRNAGYIKFIMAFIGRFVTLGKNKIRN